MMLALKRESQKGATALQRFFSWVIRTRLVSAFSHGGIVVDGFLYHSTAQKGLHVTDRWTPENWDLIDIGGDDRAVRNLFAQHRGAGYDWVSLLAFVGLRARDSRKMYRFEWCYLAMTGKTPSEKITPEILLLAARK